MEVVPTSEPLLVGLSDEQLAPDLTPIEMQVKTGLYSANISLYRVHIFERTNSIEKAIAGLWNPDQPPWSEAIDETPTPD